MSDAGTPRHQGGPQGSPPRVRVALELAGTLLLVLGSARFLTMFMHRGANLLDEGSTVAMANRILRGEVIYRDFLTVATPGSFYTVSWLFQIFGTDLMVVRWAVFAISLGILIATLIAARHLMSWPFAAASALLTIFWGWFLVAPNLYSWEAMFLALVGLVCYLRHLRCRGGSLDPPDPRGGSLDPPDPKGESKDSPLRTESMWLVLSGLACGASILVKQNTGVYATAALLLSMWLSGIFESRAGGSIGNYRWRATRSLAAGLALIVVPSLLYLVSIGAAPHLYENWVYYPTELYARGLSVDYPPFYPLSSRPGLETLSQVMPDLLFERVDELGGYEVWLKLVLYLPWLVYPFAAVALAFRAIQRQRRTSIDRVRETHALAAISIFGALTFLQAWPRADVTHILFGMQPAFVLLGYLSFVVWRFFMTLTRAAVTPLYRATMALLVLLPQFELIRSGYGYTFYGYQNEFVPIQSERARGVRANRRNAEQIDRVTSYITSHTSPGDPLFVVPWAAGFYFLTDRPNPTRFDVLLYGDPDVYPCLIATLDEHRPRYVIYGYGYDVDGKRFKDYAQPIDDYVRTRYQVAERFDEFEIWERSNNQPPVFRDAAGACRRRTFDARSFGRLLRQILGS